MILSRLIFHTRLYLFCPSSLILLQISSQIYSIYIQNLSLCIFILHEKQSDAHSPYHIDDGSPCIAWSGREEPTLFGFHETIHVPVHATHVHVKWKPKFQAIQIGRALEEWTPFALWRIQSARNTLRPVRIKRLRIESTEHCTVVDSQAALRCN
jgi:hypothetical protein